MQYLDLVLVAIVGIVAGGLAMQRWRGASLDERMAMIERAVAAVEQLYPNETGQFKFDWVFGRVRQWLPADDAELIETLIEGAVYRLKQDKPAVPQARLNGRMG